MTSTRSSGAFAALAVLCLSVRAEMSAEELANLALNPMGNLVSAPGSTRFKRNQP
jgi:hypothetical protein